jgi:hypothetical protein
MQLPYRLLSALLLTSLLGACYQEKTKELWPQAAAWLPGENGQALSFRNDTLGVETLHLTRTSRVQNMPTKSANNPQRVETIEYGGGALPTQGLQLTATEQYVVFQLIQSDGLPGGQLKLTTAADPARDVVAGFGLECELLTGYSLRNRTYARLLHARLLPAQQLPARPVVEFFYSRDEGLVAYTTRQHRRWYREF